MDLRVGSGGPVPNKPLAILQAFNLPSVLFFIQSGPLDGGFPKLGGIPFFLSASS